MKKVIFSTNLPSPYRVDFFNELGKYCDLTVLYERKNSSERDKKWVGEQAQNFKEVYLDLEPVGTDRSKGKALRCFLRTAVFDILIFTNYVSPATIDAILYCRMHKIPYFIEYDGGFNRRDHFMKGLFKKVLLKGAKGHFTTADEHIHYLVSLGIKKNKIKKYPFTSIKQDEIVQIIPSPEEIQTLRKNLRVKEEKVVLAVGQFIKRKGFDILINAAKNFDENVGFYIVGGEPTQEYLELKERLGLQHIYFKGFMRKDELADWYKAADVFAMPTREDIWGLVVNEAMAFGLPVVSSDRCIAALEMVKNEENGFIFLSEDVEQLTDCLKKQLELSAFSDDYRNNALRTASKYTIEKMASRHVELFNQVVLEGR